MKSKPILKEQRPPSHIILEFTEGCNLFCEWCPISAIRKKPGGFKHARESTIKKIISRIEEAGWPAKKIEITGHGEPLANPKYLHYFELLRIAFPKAYIFVTTNGGMLLRGKGVTYNIDQLLKYLDVVAISEYKYAGFVKKIREKYKGRHILHTFPHVPVYVKPHAKYLPCVVIYPDLKQSKVGDREITNYGGNVGPPNFYYHEKRCHRPFREIAIQYDGMVTLCCMDWCRRFKAGNVKDLSLQEIWNGREFKAMRRVLYHNGRIYNPCYGCGARLFRVGLLPDPMGKTRLIKPTKLDHSLLKRIEDEGPDIKTYITAYKDRKNVLSYIKGKKK